MVSAVLKRHRPRLGLQPPLRERWEAKRAEVVRVVPENHPGRSVLTLPCDEFTIDEIDDLLERVRREKAPPDDPRVREAAGEAFSLAADFNKIVQQLRGPAHQRWLQYAPKDWRHQLLGDLSPDCYSEVRPYDLQAANITSVPEAKQAARDVFAQLQWLRSIDGQINRAKAFEVQPHAEQAYELVQKLFERHTALLERVIKLEAKYSAVEAQLARLQQKAAKEAA